MLHTFPNVRGCCDRGFFLRRAWSYRGRMSTYCDVGVDLGTRTDGYDVAAHLLAYKGDCTVSNYGDLVAHMRPILRGQVSG